MQIISPPYETEEIIALEFTAPAAYRDFELAKARRDAVIWSGLPDEIPCAFLDETTKRCRHYDHRPKICQEFKVGDWKCDMVVHDPRVAMVHYSGFGNRLPKIPPAPLFAAIAIALSLVLLWS
jgi:hypothetical protein